MGKGDIRSRRGKIIRGTFGNTRPKNDKRRASAPPPAQAPATEKPKEGEQAEG